MNELQRMAAEAALRKMAEQGWFDICTIDKIRSACGVGRGSSETYRTLSMLHCVHYDEMRPELRAALPGLVAEVLQEPVVEFSLQPPPAPALAVVEAPAPKRRGLLGWVR